MEKVSLFCRCAFSFTAFFLTTACSSLKRSAVDAWMDGFRDRRAKNVRFSPPPSPYERRDHPDLDALWWDPATRSSLSYFSNCSQTPQTWETFQKASFPAPATVRLIESRHSSKGLYSLVEISLSGQKTKSAVFTTGKADCLFNLNLVAPPAHFEKQRLVFESFIQNFKPE